MKLTRRQAVTALTGIIAVMTERDREARAQNFNFTIPKGTVTFDVGGYTRYDFMIGDRRVTFTPEEIMDALEGKQ